MLKAKTEFHAAFKAFDNNYATPENHPSGGGNPASTLDAACEMLGVLDATLSTLRLALQRLAGVRGRDGPTHLAAAVAIALLREAHISYDAIMFLLACVASHSGATPAPVGEWFERVHSSLRELYDDVRSSPALGHLEPPPALTLEAPRIFGSRPSSAAAGGAAGGAGQQAVHRSGSANAMGGATAQQYNRTPSGQFPAQGQPQQQATHGHAGLPQGRIPIKVAPPNSASAPTAFWNEFDEDDEEPWCEEDDGAHNLGIAWPQHQVPPEPHVPTPAPVAQSQPAPPPIPQPAPPPASYIMMPPKSLLDLEPEDWVSVAGSTVVPLHPAGGVQAARVGGINSVAAAAASVAWPAPIQQQQPPPVPARVSSTFSTASVAVAPAAPLVPPVKPAVPFQQNGGHTPGPFRMAQQGPAGPAPQPAGVFAAGMQQPPQQQLQQQPPQSMYRPSPASASADWQIPLDQLIMGEKIGRGAFGEVVRAVYQGTDVAVKRMSSSNQAAADFVREVQLLIKLRHPHVVLFMGAAVTPNELCIVMEFASRGSLWAVLHGRQRTECTPRRRLQWAAETAKGMAYLHSRTPPIVHRDLKSGNLLVDEDWHVKVSDFGLARTKSADPARSQVGTYAWMAPELLEQRPYDERVDVYSFAIVLWELLTGVEPFKGLHPMQIMRAVDRGERPPVPPSPECPPDYVALMQACWSKEPERRPTFRDCLQRLVSMVAWR